MKKAFISALCTLALGVTWAGAQGTSITYQGRLDGGAAAATGNYTFQFQLYSNAVVGLPVSSLLVSNLRVSEGLFSTPLDFGAAPYTGRPLWLQISVAPSNTPPVTPIVLSPRQPITPAPYAIFANTASNAAANAVGPASLQDNAVTAAKISGGQVVKSLNGLRDFVTLAAGPNVTLTPSGNTLTIGAAGGGVSGWGLTGNAGTTPGANYIGASDNAQVRLHASGGFLVDDNTPGLSFGTTRRQMLNLWTAQFGIGIQDFTLYQRSDNQFNWFRGGRHADGPNDPGTGGLLVMNLDSSGSLFVNSSLVVDRTNANSGGLYPGLVFAPGSGEGMASKRTASGNQYGLDFYTGFQNRLSILNDGRIGVGIQQPEHSFDVNGNLATRASLLVNSKDQQDGGFPELPGILFGDYNSGEVITSQRGTNGPNRYGLDFYTGYGRRLTLANNGNVGVGTGTPAEKLHVAGNFLRVDGAGNEQAYLGGDGFGNDVQVGSLDPAMSRVVLWNPASQQTMDFEARNATVKVLTITGGSDLAEPFQMSHGDIPKGALVVIDEEHSGRLKLAQQAYDTRVAGIVSGANGINAGLTLHQEGALEGGQNVALSGRVYALADASHGSIKPGDLLTSSDTPGHVMRVNDHAKAQGAIVGKAMSALAQGQGMVLVLVSLQ